MDLSERSALSARRHPWEVARAWFFREVLASHDLLGAPARWLDAGAGDAWFAQQLRSTLPQGSEMVCWDINYTDDDVARDGAQTQAGFELTAERPAGSFDRILLLDVIEHVEDDIGFLKGILSDLLAPGGLVLISVPAYQRLFSAHDVALGHYRRYSPAQARALIESAGLDRQAEGGLFHLLLLARAGQALVEHIGRRRGGDDREATPVGIGQWTGGRSSTTLITGGLRGEGRLSLALARRKLTAPGLSYWALCRVAD